MRVHNFENLIIFTAKFEFFTFLLFNVGLVFICNFGEILNQLIVAPRLVPSGVLQMALILIRIKSEVIDDKSLSG